MFDRFEINLHICNFQFTSPDALLVDPGIGSLKKLHTLDLELSARVLTDEVIAKMMLPNLRRLSLFNPKVNINLC
jgi:hypothetical protein